jgi:hypothetical protein
MENIEGEEDERYQYYEGDTRSLELGKGTNKVKSILRAFLDGPCTRLRLNAMRGEPQPHLNQIYPDIA